MAVNLSPFMRAPTWPIRSRLRSVRVTTDSAPSRIEEITNQITGIRTVISSGVESAGYGDKRTEFRSLEELREILNGLEEELADLLGLGGRIRQIRMTNQWDKGSLRGSRCGLARTSSSSLTLGRSDKKRAQRVRRRTACGGGSSPGCRRSTPSTSSCHRRVILLRARCRDALRNNPHAVSRLVIRSSPT